MCAAHAAVVGRLQPRHERFDEAGANPCDPDANRAAAASTASPVPVKVSCKVSWLRCSTTPCSEFLNDFGAPQKIRTSDLRLRRPRKSSNFSGNMGVVTT